MVPYVLFILLAAVNVGGQLLFTSTQHGRHLNLNCTLNSIHASNLTVLISMSLHRVLSNGQEELLASVTSLGGRPVSNGGIVTSSISMDGSKESFVNIAWDPANSSLEGDYICRCSGLDNNNAPLIQNQALKLDVIEPGPGIIATPEVIEIGLTHTLTVRCYISDLAALNVSQINTIDMSYVHDGIDQLLATINIFQGTNVRPGTGIASINGYLGNADPENYLEATWQNPGLNNTGIYGCVYEGLDNSGNPVHFESTYFLNPVEPSRESLVEQIRVLQEKYDTAARENSQLAIQRDSILSRIRVLEESIKGHKICDTVDLPVGHYQIALFPDDGSGLLRVLCHVVAPGDVWTVFQKRYNGAVSFTRDFVAYDNGFGSVNTEHWLGLKAMKRIMGTGKYQIRVDIIDHNNVNHTRIYPSFDLGPSDGYRLTVDGYNDGGHGLTSSSGADFSTQDHGPQPHCAVQDFGGWWYDNCAFSNLNGQWGKSGESGVSWFELPDGRTHPLKATEMKFKRAPQP